MLVLLSPATHLQHVANCMECEKGTMSLCGEDICAQRNLNLNKHRPERQWRSIKKFSLVLLTFVI